MKRGQYGRRIQFYTHPKYGGKVPIFLNSGNGQFTALIGDLVLQDSNREPARKQLKQRR